MVFLVLIITNLVLKQKRGPETEILVALSTFFISISIEKSPRRVKRCSHRHQQPRFHRLDFVNVELVRMTLFYDGIVSWPSHCLRFPPVNSQIHVYAQASKNSRSNADRTQRPWRPNSVSMNFSQTKTKLKHA